MRAGQRRGQVAEVPGRRAAPAAHRAVVVARGGQPAVLAAQRRHQAQGGQLEVLGVVDEHVAPARRDPRAHVGLVAQEGDGAQEQVAEVERALLAQHAVVGRVEAGELALALGALVALREGGGPARDLIGGDHRLLEAVDAGDDRRQQGGRVALEVVDLERQLVDALEQHGQAVGRGDRHDERVEARLEGLVAQQARAEPVDRVDGELLEAALELVLDAGAQRVGGGLRGGEGEDLLGSQPAGRGEPRVAGQQRARLARARGAHDEQRAAAMGGDLALRGGEAVERIGHAPRI